jgi:hypothetical protein
MDGRAPHDDQAHGLTQLARRAMERAAIPGMAVGVLHHGDARACSFGIANVAAGMPVRDDSVFCIASISKLFTATLAMRLAEEGMLQLDTPIVTYPPTLRLADARPGSASHSVISSRTPATSPRCSPRISAWATTRCRGRLRASTRCGRQPGTAASGPTASPATTWSAG